MSTIQYADRSQTVLLARKGNTEQQKEAVKSHRALMATMWSFIVTAAFGVGVVMPLRGAKGLLDFATAFLVEKSLSVDNLFVFLMIFNYFQVPEELTPRVLQWGILSALVMRGVMIAAGVLIIQRFRPVLLVFSLILVVSAAKMLAPEEEETDLKDNPIVKLAHSMFSTTDEFDGSKFFTRRDGTLKATPLLVVLLCVELSDIMFAVDSIPAVVGISQDPLVVYSSNVFALLAMRSLYVLLAKSVSTFYYLKHAVALILFFIGGKMSLEFFEVHVPTWLSPAVILLLLVGGSGASLHRLHSEAQKRKAAGQDVSAEEEVMAVTAAVAIAGNALV